MRLTIAFILSTLLAIISPVGLCQPVGQVTASRPKFTYLSSSYAYAITSLYKPTLIFRISCQETFYIVIGGSQFINPNRWPHRSLSSFPCSCSSSWCRPFDIEPSSSKIRCSCVCFEITSPPCPSYLIPPFPFATRLEISFRLTLRRLCSYCTVLYCTCMHACRYPTLDVCNGPTWKVGWRTNRL